MKIKMKKTLKGAIGNGEKTIEYKDGDIYEMRTKLEMEMASVWLNDGRAEQAIEELQKKVEVENKEEAPKKKKKSFFSISKK